MGMTVGQMAAVSFRMALTALALVAIPLASAQTQEESPAAAPAKTERIVLPHIDIQSLDGQTTLIAHLFRPKAKDGESYDAPRPAVVMLHGCSGLLAPSGRFFGLYRAWARTLVEKGYVVLVVDSATPRGFGQTCTPVSAANMMLRERPKDAYAALTYLQAQPFVRADRVALMGWSQGGGVVLLSINVRSIGRTSPAGRLVLSKLAHDFVAAVAFYPGACSEAVQARAYAPGEREGWTSPLPLLVLFGESDVWTELKPCAAFLDAAKARGNPVELKTYPDAVHAFDAPNTKRTELPQYRTLDGRIPVIATDKEARADAFVRVPAFLEEKLGK